MHNYYCKNCNNMVGEWEDEYKNYQIMNYCHYTKSEQHITIYFLNCINCNKFVGLLCRYICENCFGEDEILGEENLFNWFKKYKKITNNFKYYCNNCNNRYTFRWQIWLFEELTFTNNKYYKKFKDLVKNIINFL